MEQVSVTYFAILKEEAGKDKEDIPLETGDTGAAIYLRLAEKYGFPLSLRDIRVAVGDEFVSADKELKNGDCLAFIPPVAGG